MQLSKDALEFISLLNQKKVEYLVVGGWAVSLHHKPRYTKDLDILSDHRRLLFESFLELTLEWFLVAESRFC